MPPFSLASLVSRALAVLLFLSATSRAQQEYAWSEFTGSRLTVTMDQWADNGVHYRISKMETSMAQWAEFLNAKVKSDPQGIFFPWGPQFPYDFGITRSGPDGSYLTR